MSNKFSLITEDGEEFELLTVIAEQGHVVLNNRSTYNFIKRTQQENTWIHFGKNGKVIGSVFDYDDLNAYLMKNV
jgi:hypothetical protein